MTHSATVQPQDQQPPGSRRDPSGPYGRTSGVPGPLAALFMLIVAGIGGVIDVHTGSGLSTLFAVTLIGSAVIAALAVRRREVLWVVFAPPLICVVVALIDKITTSNSLVALLTNYLTHGFPPLAFAVGAAAVIGIVRALVKR